MSLTNPKTVVTEERLSEFYQQILPYLGGMPEMLANKFSKSDMYSTDEKMIGQWIDGKPLYQRTWVFSSVQNISNVNWSTTPSIPKAGMAQIIEAKANGTAANGGQSWLIMANLDSNPTYVSFKAGRYDSSISTDIITLQYTKTTDSPVAIGIDTDYSTEEKIIGTWIDGKPIYQKTLIGTTASKAAWNTMDTGIASNMIDKVISFNGSVGSVEGSSGWVSSMGDAGGGTCVMFDVNPSTGQWEVYANHPKMLGVPAILTIRYTKTTD